MRIEELRKQRADLIDGARAIVKKVEKEHRLDLNEGNLPRGKPRGFWEKATRLPAD
jgi:hypothetical protein